MPQNMEKWGVQGWKILRLWKTMLDRARNAKFFFDFCH